MSDKDEVMQQALEALEADELDMVDDGSGNMVFRKEQAIAALRTALEQQAEPVAMQEKSCARCLHKPTWPNTSGVCGGCRFYSNFRATPPLPVQEPAAYDKTEMNSFVIDLYDKKMQEGKHGHYEIMFHVVHQAIKRVALPLPVQEDSCFCHSGVSLQSVSGGAAPEGYLGKVTLLIDGEYVDYVKAQPPLPEQPEPLEYWNAVEGWVKIDEVREHFNAVNCGTIYKHGGEGRVPLYTAPPQREWVGLTVTTILNMMPSTIPADYDGELMEFARAVEAKLKELNK